MEASRQIKYNFSGDLERPLSTYPPYPGKEKHVLKCQIVRITFANYVAPRGLYRINDDSIDNTEY
jgi:radial spoke head protein 4/6